MLLTRAFRLLCVVSGVSAASWIVPGAVWKDTAGNTIDAHGGMIYQRGTTFYWIGQAAGNSAVPALSDTTDSDTNQL